MYVCFYCFQGYGFGFVSFTHHQPSHSGNTHRGWTPESDRAWEVWGDCQQATTEKPPAYADRPSGVCLGVYFYKCIMCAVLSYLFDCLHLYTPSRTLCPTSDILSLQIPHTRLSTVGSCAFSVFGPFTWNGLPLPLGKKPSLNFFKSNCKKCLFSKTIDLLCLHLLCCCLPSL